jgi:hypothetical protein
MNTADGVMALDSPLRTAEQHQVARALPYTLKHKMDFPEDYNDWMNEEIWELHAHSDSLKFRTTSGYRNKQCLISQCPSEEASNTDLERARGNYLAAREENSVRTTIVQSWVTECRHYQETHPQGRGETNSLRVITPLNKLLLMYR